ncbi:SirB2 family protein [Simiduia sp. 21SJ11W-1]|uniref:SirB2 family protein n=1 Tax=Simiduia sp. 21SJ11W-1 TaxID=2909669 RepID=UPI00209DD5DC|nr:SirB2 family protein [Simiduia sp. 21SJ11W-1]UTA46394.1 SirB2 family protein [Simiduia sp. 21SJ11W-1]
MLLKHLHLSLALLSVSGFFIRGIWHLQAARYLHLRATRIAPHVIDFALLLTALGLLYQYQWQPWGSPWLTAKLLALLAYIGLGVLAFRFAKTRSLQFSAWLGALACAAYIVAVAITKSPTPFL